MKFYNDFMISDSINLSREELKEKMLSSRMFFHTYVIALPLYSTDDQLEIFHIELHKQPLFNLDKYIIIGVTKGHHEAIELVTQITGNVYANTGNANIKQYFMEKINE